MEEQRDDLQLSSVSDSEGMDKVFVFGCPYLGTLEDPDTSLAYPSLANHCFRPESPTSIDLGHQETYCLSDQHHACHVFQIAGSAGVKPTPVLEHRAPKKRKRRVSLYALPLILVLILLAAIIWWPAPGTTIQDSLVRGAQNVREVTGGVTLTDKPVSDPAEVEEAVAGAAVDAPRTGSTALNDGDQQQDTVESEAAVDAASEQETPGSARPASTAPVSINQNEESQADAARSERSTEQNAPSTAAQAQAAVELPAETAANVEDEADVAVEDAQTIVEDAAEAIAASRTSPEAAVTDNFEAEETAVAEVEAALPEEPLEEFVEDSVEITDSEETEELESVVTSDLPVISTDAATVSAPTVEPVSLNDAGQSVVLIGPVASSALSLGGSSGEANSLLVYKQAGDGAVLTELESKQFVTLLGRDTSGIWLNVRLQDGREGWINASDSGASGIASSIAAAPSSAASANQAVVATSYPVIRSAYVDTGALNLRTGPGVEYEAFTIIGKGQIVGLVGRRALGPWVRVRLDDGTEGWVNSSLLAPLS